MGRQRSPNRDKAFELYVKYEGRISSKEIATLLNENLKNINNWRVQDLWSKRLNKIGAPFGNRNSVGNKGGGAPPKNKNAEIHGLYSKHFPEETLNFIEEVLARDPLDILWDQILIQYAAIVRSQKIMFVIDKEDKTKELKKLKSEVNNVGSKGAPEFIETYREEEYDIQQAWDKQATFINAQSRAMTTLTNMIKKYDDMLHTNWDMATEEQKLRLDKLRVQIKNPEFQHKKKRDKEKLQLEKERFEHTKRMDELNNF